MRLVVDARAFPELSGLIALALSSACVTNKPQEETKRADSSAVVAPSTETAASAASVAPTVDDPLVVEFYDSLASQIRVDAPRLAASIRRGDYLSAGDARLAVFRVVLPNPPPGCTGDLCDAHMKLRAEFVGPRALQMGLTATSLTMVVAADAQKNPELDRREAERLAKTIDPELSSLFAALRERFPDAGGGEAGARSRDAGRSRGPS
jgi:hypothetical protein